jgi:hypothetical protein
MKVAIGFLCVLLASPAFAQSTREKGWLDVNFGVAVAAEDTLTTAYTFQVYSEPAASAAAYEWPRGGSFDLGAGWMFSNALGIGVNMAGTAHKGLAGVAVTVPHPTVFNRAATAAGDVDSLDRGEGSFNFQIMGKLPIQSDKLRIRVFAGPTFFNLQMDMVQDVRYRQTFNLLGANNVAVSGIPTEEVEGNAWGFHAGGDLSYMFSKMFGLGAQARISRGTVTVDTSNIYTTGADEQDIRVGGFQISGGIRLRF